ncbi:aldo/keto reductase [Microvirga puerhi]|uniref:Aldo/keto reductase n=1 Tax=Microvirga puerhi TaxID=2876078 RepID=A0ABS7VT60_9HYPH|nr:aldo/keto reductase [Microvirga puerhi]MBZ6078752.1 aldo/keto reductase [Microvirga puerhi]
MEKRRLGRSNLMVPPFCLGGNVFGWTADEHMSFRILDALVEAGCNFIDTADVYSRWVPGHEGGESEAIIGKWMKARGNRDQIIIATKVGSEMGPSKKGLSKARIMAAVEESLKRLQTTYIDLYQSHRDDADTPQEETLSAYADLVASGKVRVIGASNFTAARLKEALDISARMGLPRYESLQPLYNLSDRAEFERELRPLCLDNEVGVIPYYGLASGFLTGKYRSEKDFGKSVRGANMAKYLNDRGLRILSALDEIALHHNASPAQVALAWLMAQPGIAAPIASATKAEQLTELIGATRLQLDKAALDQLAKASVAAT